MHAESCSPGATIDGSTVPGGEVFWVGAGGTFLSVSAYGEGPARKASAGIPPATGVETPRRSHLMLVQKSTDVLRSSWPQICKPIWAWGTPRSSKTASRNKKNSTLNITDCSTLISRERDSSKSSYKRTSERAY